MTGNGTNSLEEIQNMTGYNTINSNNFLLQTDNLSVWKYSWNRKEYNSCYRKFSLAGEYSGCSCCSKRFMMHEKTSYHSCHRQKFPVKKQTNIRREFYLDYECSWWWIPVAGNISCSMKGIVYCWVKFLSQKERVEQNSSHKKKFSVAWRQFLLMNKIPAAGNIFHSRGKLNVAGNNSYHKPQMKEFLSQEEISCCNRSIPIAGKKQIVSERNLIVWQEFLLTNKIPVAGNISSSSGKSYATGNNSCQKKTPKKSFLIVWRKFLLMNKIPAAGNISCSKEKLYATGNNSCDEKGIQNYFLRKKYLYCRKKINYFRKVNLIGWWKFLLMNKIPAAGNIFWSRGSLYATAYIPFAGRRKFDSAREFSLDDENSC